jgi:phage baseplate assembly protein W
MSSVFGRSLAFPPRVGADGRLVWSEGEGNIRESITVVRFLFEPNNAATHARMEDAIVRALAAWEPRIEIESVEIAVDRADAEVAVATITYRLVATAARARISLNIPVAAA